MELRIPKFDIIRFNGEFCDRSCPQLSNREWFDPCYGTCSICYLFEVDVFGKKLEDGTWSKEIVRCNACVEKEKELCPEKKFDDDYPILYK